MAGFITPLPVMLEEESGGLPEEDRRVYEALEPPKSMVVRYGYQKLVAELPYSGDDKPGCGSKLVIRTQRGVELGEMLTTTCANSGCSKSVSRKDMLKYIENSGGKDFPFTDQGRILRVAEAADLNEQTRLDGRKPEILTLSRRLVGELELEMKPVDVELLLGGERVIIYYTAEQWVDFRDLVKELASELQTRIEMHQVNDREEARLVADYERCGQYCCCKNFLKVLKPVSMRSAKVQKATLDPQKISGRCGRLMCCLRYEDATYETLRKNLPHRKSLVETEDGVGLVLSSQILTQLVLVKIGQTSASAYPLENIRVLNKEECAEFRKEEKERLEQQELAYARRSGRGGPPGKPSGKAPEKVSGDAPGKGRRPRRPARDKPSPAPRESSADTSPATQADDPQAGATPASDQDSTQHPQASGEGDNTDAPKRKRRRRRRGRRRKPGQDGEGDSGSGGGNSSNSGGGGGSGGGTPGGEG